MDENKSKETPQPKRLMALLPELSGMFRSQESKNEVKKFIEKMQIQTTVAIPPTAVQSVKPLPFDCLTPFLTALNQPLPSESPQYHKSTRRKNWNSSVKVNKTVNHTDNKQLAHTSVRKVLKFIPKPKPIELVNAKTSKFLKPGLNTKQTSQIQGKVNCRISGITNIAETPTTQNIPKYKKRTINNKENNLNKLNKATKPCATPVVTPKIRAQKNILKTVPETPLSNESWKSSCDASFLQTEKEIQDIDDKTSNGNMLEDTILNGLKPLNSTAFKEYRQEPKSFKNTSNIENSVATCFDKVNRWREDNKREESVIVSVSKKLNEAKVNDYCKRCSILEDLLEINKSTEHVKDIIDQTLNSLEEELHLKYLNNIKDFINEKIAVRRENVLKENETVKKDIIETELSSSSRHCSVIRSSSKSPSYKIPKRNSWSRNKLLHKSVANVPNGLKTPDKNEGNKALNMYMQMKEELQFLKTPLASCKRMETLNTPTATSRNLQIQLDKLYNYS